jgi:hypothetical protein
MPNAGEAVDAEEATFAPSVERFKSQLPFGRNLRAHHWFETTSPT